MRRLILSCMLLTACATSDGHSRIDAMFAEYQHEVDVEIPARIQNEYTAKYGADTSKWPKAPTVSSQCQSFRVRVEGRPSRNVSVC